MDAPDIDLVPLQPNHAEAMFACLRDPTAYRFVPDEPPASVTALRGRYERLAVGRSADGSELWCNWMVRDRGSAQPYGFTQATIKDRCALIAYHLDPRYWRQGIGSHAVGRTARLLFQRDDVERLLALVDTRNAASAALLCKLGFTLVAHHAQADFFKGESSDESEFELTRASWRAARATADQGGGQAAR